LSEPLLGAGPPAAPFDREGSPHPLVVVVLVLFLVVDLQMKT
jgi:hypothetical protein